MFYLIFGFEGWVGADAEEKTRCLLMDTWAVHLLMLESTAVMGVGCFQILFHWL